MINVEWTPQLQIWQWFWQRGAGKVDETKFQEALDLLCIELSKMIARDGEGATKLIISEVEGAKSDDDARKIARSVISSNLLKCPVYAMIRTGEG